MLSHTNYTEIIADTKNNNLDSSDLSNMLNVDMHDSNSLSLLHCAVMMNDEQMVLKLIESGAKIDAKNAQGETPLHWAAWLGHKRLFEILIAKNADINNKTMFGDTVLSGAIKFHRNDIVQSILENPLYSLDNTVTNDSARSVSKNELLNIATAASNIVATALLIQQGALPTMSYCRDIQIATLLLELGIDINQKDDFGRTLLNQAIRSNNVRLIQFALEKNADMKTMDSDGMSPLLLLGENTKFINGQDKQEIQLLFVPFLIKNNLKNEFIYLVQNNLFLEKIDINALDDADKCLMWICELLAYDNNERLQAFATCLVDKLYPGQNEIFNKLLSDDPFQFKLALLSYSKKELRETLSIQYRIHLADKALSTRIINLLRRLNESVDVKNNDLDQLEITLDAPIEKHAAYLFHHIYSVPYEASLHKQPIARFYHGISHTSRAASLVPILVNLYKKYGDKNADVLKEEDIKLLQIAVLLHDAGREKEGEDFWDLDSGLLVYYYLKKLNVSENRAKLFAEAVANKDTTGSIYFELDANLKWKTSKRTTNILQKIIHDVDSLDIIRARDHFDAEYLNFYQELAKYNDEAFEEMAQLITEVRSLIERTGDGPCKDPQRKVIYENENGYQRIINVIKNCYFPIMGMLHSPTNMRSVKELEKLKLLNDQPYKPDYGLDECNIQAAMREGKLYVRAINLPTKLGSKVHYDLFSRAIIETQAKLELRKTDRRVGVPTLSKKSNRILKHGNPNRSISMIGFGAGVYGNAGFLIVNLDVDAMTSFNDKNANSGFAKKECFIPPYLTLSEKEDKIKELIIKMKKGGSATRYNHFASTHVEITSNLEKYDGIYFTKDPTPSNVHIIATALPAHPLSPLLQAIYIQKEYENIHGVKLPVFEYSGLHNSIIKLKESEYSDEKLVEMWLTICRDFINKDPFEFINNIKKSIEDIKISAIYGKSKYINHQSFLSADSNYNVDLIKKINDGIYKEIENCLLKNFRDIKQYSDLLAEIYLQIPYFKYEPELKWIKRIVNTNSQLIALLCELPLEARLMFLQKLGRRWLREIATSQEIHLLAMYLNDEDAKAFLDDQQIYESNLASLNKFINAIKSGNQILIEHYSTNFYIINNSDKYEYTPLHWAVMCDNIDLVKQLLSNDVDINAVSQFGETPLHLAAWYGHQKIVEFLLKKGADPLLETYNGKTAIQGAIQFGYSEIAKKLDSACIKRSESRHSIFSNPSIVMLRQESEDDFHHSIKP